MDNKQIYYQPASPQVILKYAVVIVPVLVIIAILTTSFYTVDTNAEGVVQRFGKYVRTEGPGLHFKWPIGIETVQKPSVERIFKAEFGQRTLKAGIKSTYGQKNTDESVMLCGDLSVADVEWIVQYKISNSRDFLFNLRNPEKVIRDVSESVMRSVVGDSSVDEVLTSRRNDISNEAAVKMQAILDSYKVGIKIDEVKLQDVNPPEKVKPAFNEVNAAQQDRERMINKALEEYNKVIPRARGQALQMIKQAEAYAIDRTNTATGDASRFTQIWAEYKESKDVTRRRLYLESMGKVLPLLHKKYIVDKDVKGLLPLMQIGEE